MSTLMRIRPRRSGFVAVIAGLMLGTLGSSRADASIIRPPVDQMPVYYSTTGTLGAPGAGPVDFLEFVGVNSAASTPTPAGVFYMPGVFSLGGFQTRAVPAGQGRTFDALPFSITLNLFRSPFAGEIASQILIEGALDGELSPAATGGLLASITSVRQVGTPIGVPPFRVQDLQILAPQFVLPAGPLPSMTTPFYGYVNAQQVPEPTALATLGVGLAALVVHRRRRRGRDRAAATA